KKQEEEKKEDDNEEKKANNEKKERKKVKEQKKDQITKLLKEVLKAMIKFSKKKIIVTQEGMFKFDELQNFIMNKVKDISANQIAQLMIEMEAMHPEQTIFIIDPSLPDIFHSQFIPVVEHDFTKWVDLSVELKSLLNKLLKYESRVHQQYGSIGLFPDLKKSMDEISSNMDKISSTMDKISSTIDKISSNMDKISSNMENKFEYRKNIS
ncbi:hypothetical protein RFI_21429, partial [Reticulomyxa filosa]